MQQVGYQMLTIFGALRIGDFEKFFGEDIDVLLFNKDVRTHGRHGISAFLHSPVDECFHRLLLQTCTREFGEERRIAQRGCC